MPRLGKPALYRDKNFFKLVIFGWKKSDHGDDLDVRIYEKRWWGWKYITTRSGLISAYAFLEAHRGIGTYY